ncbi:MAG TPA: CHAD domain-containing protein [Mycobacteriales bacterium]
MSDRPVTLVWTTAPSREVDGIARVLGPAYSLLPERRATISRVWLDTFDWRLREAGVDLEHRQGGGRSLTLRDGDGQVTVGRISALRWPALVDDLPAGSLRDRLRAVAGIRALMPVAEARTAVREVAIRNDDAKTVARLTLERSAGDPRGPIRMVIAPLRGYAADTTRIVALLSRVPGIADGARSAYDDAVAAHPLRALDVPTHERGSVSPALAAPAAIAGVLLQFATTIAENVEGVTADVDTEFLHDLRVAVRRTRSVLKLTGDVLPGGLADRFGPEFRRLGDLTTPTRDLDVYLLGLPELARRLRSARPADLAPLADDLRRRRRGALRGLVRALRSARFAQLQADWREALTDPAVSAGPEIDLAELADQRVRRAYRRVRRQGLAIGPASADEELHTLRKRCKELRYLLEIFAPMHDRSQSKYVGRELKRLQDSLGAFQDASVQREATRTFAEQIVAEGSAPAATVLAMGELMAHLDADHESARVESVELIERFDGADVGRRIRALSDRVAG